MTSTHPLPFQRFLHWLALLACGVLLAACGGGGGNPGTTTGTGTGTGTGTVPTLPTMTLSFVNAGGTPANVLTSAALLNARAVVLDSNGRPVANALVTFTGDTALVRFAPAIGTSLTDAAGVAVITLNPASLTAAGAGKITAAATVAGTALTAEANLTVTPTASPTGNISITLANAAGQSTNVVSNAIPLTAKAMLTDKDGKPVANAVVTFAADPTLLSLTPTALSDTSGVATVTLRPATSIAVGAGTLTASASNGGVTVTGSTTFSVTATTTAPATPTIALSFVNAAGQSANAITAATPLTARALVQDPTGKPIVNALVSFSTDNTLAVFTPSSGTTLTNSAGLASVTMLPASLAANGAGKVSASVTVAGSTVSGDANFSVGATTLSLGTLQLAPASIAAYGSTIVTLDVLAGGVPYTDQQVSVNFTSACVSAGKATFAAKVPTNNGRVQSVYRDQGCGSNDVITASVDGITRQASANLAIAVPAAASIQFSAAVPTDRSIVIQGQGGIGRTETATLTFKVFDTFNKPLARQHVTFSTTSPDVTINKASDSTDAAGEVITTVNSGSKPTTFRVIATLDSGIATNSDSIVVTTGVAVQKAFSLSVTSDNVEGWTYDSGPSVPATNVNILVADNAGNPVADGTPIVFQTNMGSVGSASKGACNTVNGGCSVDFRTQDPRNPAVNSPATPCNNYGAGGVGFNDSTRTGLATVCASSTDGVTTLFKKITIFFSGTFASNVYLNGATTPLTSGPSAIVSDLGDVGASDSKVFSLLVSDINQNPMPAGTKVEIANIANGAAVGVGPATVPNIFAHSAAADDPLGNTVSGNQGSYHTVTIGSVQPKPCLGPLVSTFNVAITTPAIGSRVGSVTSYPFKVRFTCP